MTFFKDKERDVIYSIIQFIHLAMFIQHRSSIAEQLCVQPVENITFHITNALSVSLPTEP